jgi:hypothetical protein
VFDGAEKSAVDDSCRRRLFANRARPWEIERPAEELISLALPVMLRARLSLFTSFDCFDSNRDFLGNTVLLANRRAGNAPASRLRVSPPPVSAQRRQEHNM